MADSAALMAGSAAAMASSAAAMAGSADVDIVDRDEFLQRTGLC